jgi:4-aminobutyrate aminotransferase-like enzyme
MIPGPRSRRLAARLRRVESRNITYLSENFPVFWESANGCRILDADGNSFLDLTGAFAVSSLGHSSKAVRAAIETQARKMWHGMGDVHPSRVKVEFLEALCKFLPGKPNVCIPSCSGSDAVESAVKTARLKTGRAGILVFEGAYHGLSYGTLPLTDRQESSGPFSDQLGRFVFRAPYPDSLRGPDPEACLKAAQEIFKRHRIGAILVEPMQGRGGMRIPRVDFLKGLEALAGKNDALLIFDEIFTGFGRTGRWFAWEHAGIEPDLMAVGKAMSNGFPISACVGRRDVMNAWPPSDGEAIHTGTFLGNPLGCAMGLASLREMKRLDLARRSAALGGEWKADLVRVLGGLPFVGEIRGSGLFIGIEIVKGRKALEPDAKRAAAIVSEALHQKLIILSCGKGRNVIGLTPPLTIKRQELEEATNILIDVFVRRSPAVRGPTRRSQPCKTPGIATVAGQQATSQ